MERPFDEDAGALRHVLASQRTDVTHAMFPPCFETAERRLGERG